MPPKASGEAKVGGATNDNVLEKQRSIQTRSARAGLQVCLSQDTTMYPLTYAVVSSWSYSPLFEAEDAA